MENTEITKKYDEYKTNYLYHKNGDRISTIRYKNNKIDGIKEEYYPANRIKSLTSYKKGKKHGIETHYSHNGHIQKEITYKYGRKIKEQLF